MWDRELRRSFQCAGRTVCVYLSALRSQAGQPTFSVTWQPTRPERLNSADIEHFTHMHRQAKAELLTELETIQC